MRKLRRVLLAIVVVAVILCLGAVLWLSDKYTVPIMMYHSVNTVDNPEAPTVRPEMFDMHMKYLDHWKFNVLSLEEFVRLTKEGKPFPKRSVVITFDDGFEDNYTQAFPTLKEYGFPATIFVPSNKIGSKGRLKKSQLQEMARGKITIASHTNSETYLPKLSEGRQWDEFVASKEILEGILGREVKFVSYPIGGFSEKIKELAQKAGYIAACATNRGYDRFNKDVYEINRIRFGNKDKTDVIMRVKLSGYYNLFRRAKSPH